jgi:hypothetical protein
MRQVDDRVLPKASPIWSWRFRAAERKTWSGARQYMRLIAQTIGNFSQLRRKRALPAAPTMMPPSKLLLETLVQQILGGCDNPHLLPRF